MKLTYWISHCMTDAPCYSIRRKTRTEVLETIKHYESGDYSKPEKVTVEYRDAFDLMFRCTSEGGLYEAREDAIARRDEARRAEWEKELRQ